MRINGEPPPASRDRRVLRPAATRSSRPAGKIKLVQVYTVARPPAESFVTPLTDEELEAIAAKVRQLGDYADEPARRAAWRALCARYGSGRAAWIAQRTRALRTNRGTPSAGRRTGHSWPPCMKFDRLAAGPTTDGLNRLAALLAATAAAFAGGSVATGVRIRLRDAGASAAHKIAGLKVGSGERLGRRGRGDGRPARRPGEPGRAGAGPVPGEPVIDDK